MEPLEAQVTYDAPPIPRIVWVIYTRAKRVELRGLAEAKSWWVQFDGSWESLHFGEAKPFEEGDMVKITFEKVIQNA